MVAVPMVILLYSQKALHVCNEHCSVYTSLWLIITCFRLRIAYVEVIWKSDAFQKYFVTQSLNLRALIRKQMQLECTVWNSSTNLIFVDSCFRDLIVRETV